MPKVPKWLRALVQLERQSTATKMTKYGNKKEADIYRIQDRVIQAYIQFKILVGEILSGKKEQQARRRLEETMSRKNETKHPETSRETELKCIKRKRPRNQPKHSIKEDSIGKKPIGYHYWQRHEKSQVGLQGDRFWTLNFHLIPFKK